MTKPLMKMLSIFLTVSLTLATIAGCAPKNDGSITSGEKKAESSVSIDGNSDVSENNDDNSQIQTSAGQSTEKSVKPIDSSGTVSVSSSYSKVSVTFGEKVIEKGIKVKATDTEKLDTGTIGGKGYWQLMKGNHGTDSISLAFDEAFKKDIEKYNLFVLLEYYGDNAEGTKFDIVYTSGSGFKTMETSFHKASTWTGSGFDITDYKSNKSLDGADLKIVLGKKMNQMKVASVKIIKKSKNAVVYPALVQTKYSTRDAIVAEANVLEYGAMADGEIDDTLAFRIALSAVSEKGGGVVFVPAGTYKLTESLEIPDSVVLRGDSDPEKGAVGTILKLMPRTVAQGNTDSFFKMKSSAGLKNVVIWYPEQKLAGGKATPYPYTIEMVEHYGITVEDVYLVNVYDGIKMGPSQNTLQTIRNIYGTPLHIGMEVDYNLDIARFENIHFSFDYWTSSKMAGTPSSSTVKSWLLANATGFVLRRIDWSYLTDFYVSGYKIGLQFSQSKNGTGNGQIYRANITDCNTCLLFEETNPYGYLISNSKLSANGGSNPVAIKFASTYKEGATSLNKVDISSSGVNAILLEGSGQVSLQNCNFNMTSSKANFAIDNKAGKLTVNTSNFSGQGKHIHVDSQTVVSNCMTAATLKLQNGKASASVSYDTNDMAPKMQDVVASTYAQRNAKPTGTKFVNLASYGVKPGTTQNIASKLQQAVNDVAAAGGGVVYVPYGVYRLESAITVKSGVEIKGSNDTPHHTNRRSTIFYTDYGKNQLNGTALFTLESKAGIRGFSVFYDKQNSDALSPYAYTVRGNGSNVYVVNVTLSYTYQGIDMMTERCDNHYIEGIGMGALYRGVAVGGNSKNGIVRDVQANIHYITDNPHPGAKREGAGFDPVLYNEYECFLVSTTQNQTLLNNFIWGVWHGLAIKDKADVTVIGQGCDNSRKGIYLNNCSGQTITLINTQIVCLGDKTRSYILADNDFKGTANIYNVSGWGAPSMAAVVSGGTVNVASGVLYQPGICAMLLNNGHASVSSMLIGATNQADYVLENSIDASVSSFRIFGNITHSNNKVLNNSSLKVQGSDAK